MTKQPEVLKIVILYAILGCIWIYLSDSLLIWIVRDPLIIGQVAMFKGLFFILSTSCLLFFLISRLNTKLKRSTSELHKSESHLKTLIQAIPDLVWLKNKDGVYLSCNLEFERFFGAKQSEIIGKTDYDFVGKDLADFFREHDLKAVKAGRPTINEEWITFSDDGHHALLETIKTPVRNNNGELIGILGIGRDITARKQMEDELRESEDKFRLTFSFSPDAININRLEDGLYVDVNDGFSRITGFTRDDVIGKTSLELNIWADVNDRNVLAQGLKDKGFYENMETKFRRKDGKLITGLMSAKIITLKGVPHIISISRDISKRKQYERELLKMEKLESLGILAGGIAHDFNNILTGVTGNISLANMHLDATHKSSKPLAAAEKAALRAGELAQQLLTFARGGEPIKKIVSPRHIVEEALSLILHGSNVKEIVDIPDSIHAFKADEGQISQVFHNIIINATHAMPTGGTLTIIGRNETLNDHNKLSLTPGEYLRLIFADQGCGIPGDDITKIFDPYFTTKSTGNGLGLASAYSIITKHGGCINVSSVVGEGTTFTIYLPSLGETYSLDQVNALPLEHNTKIGNSVLVMDDDAIVREIAESMLKHLGYEVTTCVDGDEAVELYKQASKSDTPYYAVIMDLTIPGGLGGKQAAKKILEEFPKAFLIVSSGYSNDSVMSHYKDYGFIGAINKPYSINDFKTVLNSLPM